MEELGGSERPTPTLLPHKVDHHPRWQHAASGELTPLPVHHEHQRPERESGIT